MIWSKNLVLILTKVLEDQELCKLIAYNSTNPLAQPNIDDPQGTLMFDKVMPYPFDTSVSTDDCVQLRAYYLGADFKSNKEVEETRVSFDIICAKSLWLANTGEPIVRPYEIMEKIINIFDNVSIGTLGRLHFTSFRHITLTQKFDLIQLIAEMTTYDNKDRK